MGLRTKMEASIEVGRDGALDDLSFEDDLSELFDTLDHVEHGVYDLDASEQDAAVDFGDVAESRVVYFTADGEVEVVFGGAAATAAQLDGSGATYPTSFVGGETLLVTIDVTALTVTFVAGETTLVKILARINSEAALQGLATPVATDDGGGQARLTSPTVGTTSIVNVTGGTGRAALGLAITSVAGTNSQPNTSNLKIHRPADPTGASAAAGLKSWFAATLRTTSIRLTNPDASNAVRVSVCIVGDLVSST